MSNETDLGWLARNVHNWPAGHQGWCYVISNRDGTKGVATSLIGQVDCPWVRIEKQEWLTRRVELQNKPGWADFGESAKFMAQDSDGAWMAFEIEPTAKSHVWSAMRGWCGYAREGRDRCRGEVLGDWRDTLEKRPEEFQPFTSIEDNQEKAMKQDNGWHERGELPPVGTWCEAYCDGAEPEKCKILVYHKQQVAVQWSKFNQGCLDVLDAPGWAFRPIRTELDVLLSIIVEEMNRYDTDGKLADAILAAGFKRGAA